MDITVRGTLISTVGSKASSERGSIVKSQGLIKPNSGLEMRHPATVIHMTRFRVSPWTFARVSRLPLTPNCKQLWTQVLVFRHADASPIAKASTHLQPQRWCVLLDTLKEINHIHQYHILTHCIDPNLQTRLSSQRETILH